VYQAAFIAPSQVHIEALPLAPMASQPRREVEG